MSYRHFQHLSHHLGLRSRSCNTRARRSRAISATSQLGTVGLRYSVHCGPPWMLRPSKSRKTKVSTSPQRATLTLAEFELVTQALWTDPNDQSGWLYHRWLIGTSQCSAYPERIVVLICQLHLIRSCDVRSIRFESCRMRSPTRSVRAISHLKARY